MKRAAGAGLWLAAALAVPAGVLRAQAADADAQAAKAREAYAEVVNAYMRSNWSELKDALQKAAAHTNHMTAEQRGDLHYVRQTAPEFRPPWWESCKSTARTRIRAKIWGRNILCDYLPADNAGMQASTDGLNMTITVSWNPSLVDSTVPEPGQLAQDHGLTRGDIGEVTVWRQLGFSYITASLPAKTILALYNNNRHLYQHLQEFYANVTCMYHCSPKARRTAMLVHGGVLYDPKNTPEAHVRTCRAISALFQSLVLTDPKKWPSINLPYTVPEDTIERKVGAHLYNNMAATWTLAEDRAFREALRDFFRTNGERALRQRGALLLPNKLVFMLVEPDDRPFQQKRDEWVKKQLQKAG